MDFPYPWFLKNLGIQSRYNWYLWIRLRDTGDWNQNRREITTKFLNFWSFIFFLKISFFKNELNERNTNYFTSSEWTSDFLFEITFFVRHFFEHIFEHFFQKKNSAQRHRVKTAEIQWRTDWCKDENRKDQSRCSTTDCIARVTTRSKRQKGMTYHQKVYSILSIITA